MFGGQGRRFPDTRATAFDTNVIQYPMFASANTTGVAATGFDQYGASLVRTTAGRFPGKYANVSFDTSSREPHLLRSRVFVGNINTQTTSREDLIDLYSAYGTLLAVTVFKGYAFLQFSSTAEADNAVANTNKMEWGGCMLDVKLAISGMKNNVAATSSDQSFKNGGQRGVKRSNESTINASNLTTITVKRERQEPAVVVEPIAVATQNDRNRHTAEKWDNSAALYSHGLADTLICGGCRWVTSDLAAFCEHRAQKDCTLEMEKPETKTASDEPDILQCFTCSDECSSSWGLIQHLVSRHGLSLYKK